ncbi:hypothetical protein E2C01_100889 [Portunus trituberculatus]|uniref:Uncharacterized protein n=1 Tax=Portunus trituberculatus TaxID=210409 RepID=A0A5B7KIN5_PORTR|nr:hypothetical protein [Portunus trituberculatus]
MKLPVVSMLPHSDHHTSKPLHNLLLLLLLLLLLQPPCTIQLPNKTPTTRHLFFFYVSGPAVVPGG